MISQERLFSEASREPEPLSVISYGGGQDSTALILAMMADDAFRERWAPGRLITIMAHTGLLQDYSKLVKKRNSEQFERDMNFYIAATEYAVQNLIAIVFSEEQRLREEESKYQSLTGQYEAHRLDFVTSDLHDDFSDAYVMNRFSRMAQAQEARQETEAKIAQLQETIAAHEESVQSVCGAILQIAKQGISTVHRSPTAAPLGRSIGSVSLREIVWQGRNQAMHYEESALKDPVKHCFDTLKKEQGEQFSLTKYAERSRAKEIVELLEWTSYAQYEKDMCSLLS